MDPRALDRFRTGQALQGPLLRELVGRHGAGAIRPAGSLVGPWRILELLGSGGMAHVYLAERADGEFEQRVALKLVCGNVELSHRLRHERQIVAGLRHPHIVSLVDGGDTVEGDLWFAMALVEGTSIDAHVRAHALDWRACLRLFDTVCAAVEYAHGRGLIHRDLKPGNILVDGGGHPRLLDFGIALAEQDADAADRVLTPGFASPEQLAGQEISTRSDIYQLGLVLRALLAAAPAATGAVRTDLERLLATATAAAPEQRYPAVTALREDLDAVLSRRPLAQDRATPRIRFARLLERQRHAAIVFALAAVVLVASLALAAWRLSQEHRQALAHAQRADGVARFLVDTLSQANPYAANGSNVSVLEAMDFAASKLDAELGDAPEVRRELRLRIGGVYLNLDEGRRCLDLFAGTAAAADLAQATPLWRARSLILNSECHLVLDQRALAWQQLDAAREALADQSGTEADALRAFILVDRGQLRSLDDRIEEANRLFEQALELARQSHATEQEYRATRMFAANLQTAGDDRHAVELLQRALGLARQVYGTTHRSALTTAGLLAVSLARLERWEEAEGTVRDALAAAESIQHRGAGADVVIAQLRDGYANVLWQQGRLTDCIEQAGQALAIYRRVAEPNSTQGFNPSWRVATCAYQLRDLAQSRVHAEAALGYAENGSPVGKINALRMLAAVAARSDDPAAAKAYLERADAALAVTEVTSPTVFSAMFLTHALLAAQTGDAATARTRLAEADRSIEHSGQNPAWLRQERESVAAMIDTGSPQR
ncbi:MAG: serine/threonine protein kinase [Xanthomonadales bacterium]|nr:serine/threonine protein kinase [Xanthomonadales bacterium]